MISCAVTVEICVFVFAYAKIQFSHVATHFIASPLNQRMLQLILVGTHNKGFYGEIVNDYLSLVMRKPAFCICENKDADQLRGNREAEQRLCFRYTDSKIPLLPKSEISSLQPSSVAV